jgi:hypothetical protein
MILLKHRLYIAFIAILSATSCEFETTEYQSILDPVYFSGFSFGYFILHQNSIDYYSYNDNKVFPNLYEHQNGMPPGNGIYSFEFGLITYQEDNKIEFIDRVNFLSEGILEIDNPRNISGFPGYFCIVSYGDPVTGGIAIVDISAKEFSKIIHTGIGAGKIYLTGNYFYIFSDGNSINDSTIIKFYYEKYSPASVHKLDSIPIGIRPVDFVGMTIHYEGYSHNGLAILCRGNGIDPASIVSFDLVTEEVVGRYIFASTDIIPENLFWFPLYYTWENEDPAQKVLISYVNNKLYVLKLDNPIEMSILINRNISDLVLKDDCYLAVSRDTTGTESYLYRFDRATLDLVDSLSIPPRALKLID